jgi:hypothetical protein
MFGTIWVNFGSPSPVGMTPGDETDRRLVMTGRQMQRLAEFFESWEVIQAIGLIVEHGDLRLDPPRIEVPGYKQEWLEDKGMPKPHARRAAAALKKHKFMEKVFGDRGAAGQAIGVLSGDRFNWPRAVGYDEQGRRRVQSTNENVQVSGVLSESVISSERSSLPVDNSDLAFGDIATERSSRRLRSVAMTQSDGSPEQQVSAFGESAAERESTGAPREEVVEEESLLSPSPDAVAPLTRANLHRFIGEPRLREALEAREVQTITSLASLFRRDIDTSRGALAFFNRPCGEKPDIDLAWFVYDLLTVTVSDVATVAHSLASMLRSKGARIPKMPANETVAATVVALAATMDKEPRSWPGFVVWAMDHDGWNNSTSIKTFVSSLNAVVFSPAALAAPENPAPALAPPSGDTIAGLPERAPQASTGPLSLAEEEMQHRGEGYWQWLREEVIPGSEFDGEQSEDIVLRSRRIQDMLIRAHRNRS